MNLHVLLFLTLLLSVPLGCQAQPLPDRMNAETLRELGLDSDVSFQPDVRYLTPEESATAARSGTLLSLPTSGNPWLDDVREGDVLWSPQGESWEDAFAYRVVSMEEHGATVLFEVQEAEFTDVFASVSFDLDDVGGSGDSAPSCEIGPAPPAEAEGALAADAGGRFPAYRDGLWGYIDRSGSWVIEPRFYRADPFSEGLAAVQPCKEGLWGFIDEEGDEVIAAAFAATDPFSEHLAPVLGTDERLGMVDTTGQVVFWGDFGSLYGLSDGLARAETNRERAMLDEIGFIDRTGEWVISPSFDNAGDFADGLATASQEYNEWGYIDTSGAWAIPPRFRDAGTFASGLAPVETGVLEWTYIDRSGNAVFDETFREAFSFSEGIALVETDDGKRYINTEGETIFAEADGKWLCRARPFHDGLAMVQLARQGARCEGGVRRGNIFVYQNAVMAYVDREGRVVYEREGRSVGSEESEAPQDDSQTEVAPRDSKPVVIYDEALPETAEGNLLRLSHDADCGLLIDGEHSSLNRVRTAVKRHVWGEGIGETPATPDIAIVTIEPVSTECEITVVEETIEEVREAYREMWDSEARARGYRSYQDYVDRLTPASPDEIHGEMPEHIYVVPAADQ